VAEAFEEGLGVRPQAVRWVIPAAIGPALLCAAVLLQPAAARAAAPAADAAVGERVYARWCVHCHAAGRGNPGTQSLQVKYGGRVPAVLLERTDLTPAAVAMFVRQGVQSMAGFRKTEITDAELAALAAFVAPGKDQR
jgi:mono/diheme cytochrome c family protein